MAILLGRLAGAAAHHWKRSVLALVAVLLVLGALAAAGGEFSDEFSTPGTESQSAYDLLAERFPAQSGDTANVVFAVENGTLRDGARASAVERTVAEIASQPNVTSAVSPPTPASRSRETAPWWIRPSRRRRRSASSSASRWPSSCSPSSSARRRPWRSR